MGYTLMGEDYCVRCNHIMDAATSASGKEDYVPKPFDLTICMYCGQFMQYSADMSLQELPKVVFDTLDLETQQTLIKAKTIIDIMAMEKKEEEKRKNK